MLHSVVRNAIIKTRVTSIIKVIKIIKISKIIKIIVKERCKYGSLWNFKA